MQTGLEYRESKNEDERPVRTMYGTIRYDVDSEVMQDLAGDEFVEVFSPGVFDRALQERTIKVVWSHDRTQVLGSTKPGTLRLRSDDEGLHYEVDLPDTTAGRDAWESIRRGDVDGVSFGFRARKEQWSQEQRDGKRPLFRRRILDADLVEISPTAFPAYPSHEIHVRSLDEYRESVKADDGLELRKRKLALELELL